MPRTDRSRRTTRPNLALSPRLQKVRQRALNDFYFFAKEVLRYSRLWEPLHRPLCEFIADREHAHKIIEAARNFFKSTLASIAYPLWRACHNPNITILLASSSVGVSRANLLAIKAHLELNERFRELFPDVIPPDPSKARWGQEALTLNRTQNRTASTFEAMTLGQRVVGRKFDLIVEDDLLAPREDDYGHQGVEVDGLSIQKAINWHKASYALYSHPMTGEHLVIGTPWALRDHLWHVKTKEADQYVHYFKPARDEKGKPTFPHEMPLKRLKQLERSLGPWLFSSQYLLKPVAEADKVWRESDIVSYGAGEAPNIDKLDIVAAVDPAIKQGRTANFTAFAVVGVDDLGYRWVLEAHQRKTDTTGIVDEMFDIAMRYGDQLLAFYVEDVAMQAMLEQIVRQDMRRRNYFFNVEPLPHPPGDKKVARIRGMHRYFRAGAVKMAEDQHQLAQQLLAFPDESFGDDLADALEMCLSNINAALPADDEPVVPVRRWRPGDFKMTWSEITGRPDYGDDPPGLMDATQHLRAERRSYRRRA